MNNGLTLMRKIDLMAFADECNRNAAFPHIRERQWKGKMKFLRQYLNQNGLCYICKKWFSPSEMTKDHIIPKAKNGGTQWDNIQLACRECNMAKADKEAKG